MSDVFLRQNERIDDLQYKGLRLIQNPNLFCFGTDSVLLANFCNIKNNERVIDLCTGNGIIPMLLSAKDKAKSITGVELQAEQADIARRNVLLNSLEDTVNIIHGNIIGIHKTIGCEYDVVCVNPPYEKLGAGARRDNESLNISRHETECTLDDVVKCAAKLLKTGGRFYIIYRISRFCELIFTMKQQDIEPKVIRLVCKNANSQPNYVLIEGHKQRNSGVIFLPNLNLYDEHGNYTQELKEIYHIE